MNRSDLAVGTGLVVLGGAMACLTLRFPDTGEYIGPDFMPRVVGGVLVLLGLALAVRSRRPAAAVGERLPKGAVVRACALVAAVAGYLLLLVRAPGLGFPLLAPPLLFVVGLLFGGRPGLALGVASVATGIGTYVLFRLWLGLPLPPSAWF